MTKRIQDMETINVRRLPPPDKEEWTAIIPAAGRGTRLGDERPKILYPLLGKPMLEWLISTLDPFVERFVFVLSAAARSQVEPLLKARLEDRYDIAIQPSPNGMADAVWQAKSYVRTPECLVQWGDQTALSKETIAACQYLHGCRPNAALTFPTLWREKPYIHFERDKNDRLVNVYQVREEKQPLAEGENDCGIFFFKTKPLFDIIKAARAKHWSIGKVTGEFNLLPLLPLFDRNDGEVLTLRIHRLEETFGVNTPEEARRMEDILKARL
jgi:bifunctional UDP-N-acetylglucosamine pyrophosphorylase/glucosamine-1-phosphate N-acetyltransferase